MNTENILLAFILCFCAAVFAVVCALVGILVAVIAGTPVGSTIVAANLIGFFLFSVVGRIAGGRA